MPGKGLKQLLWTPNKLSQEIVTSQRQKQREKKQQNHVKCDMKKTTSQ